MAGGEGITAMIDRLEKFTFYILLITLFVMPFSISLNEFFSVLTLLCWVLLLWRRKEFPRVPPLGWFFLLFLLAAMASAAASDYKGQALTGVWDIFRYTAVFFIILDVVKSDKQVRKLCWVLIISAGLWVIAGSIHQFLILKLDPFKGFKFFALGDKNALGRYLVMVLSLSVGLWINKSLAPRYRAFLGVLILIFLSGIIASSSRTVWVAFILTTFVFAILTRSRILIIGLGCILVAFMAGSFMNTRIQGMSSTITSPIQSTSMKDRYLIWTQSYKMFIGNPVLGVGPKCFSKARERNNFDLSYEHAHNLVVHTGCEMGIVGVAALFLWMSFYIYFVATYRKKVQGPLSLGIWFGGVGYVVVLVIGGITEPTIGGEHSQLFMTIAGLMQVGLAIRSPRLQDESLQRFR